MFFKTYAVTRECFLLLRKEKAFATLLIGLAVVTVVAKLVSQWSFDNPTGIFFNITQTAFRLSGTFIAIYFGIKMLHDYRTSGSVEIMLSRPISRAAFLQGNFMALTALLFIYGLIAGLGWLIVALAFSLHVPYEFIFWGVVMSFGEWFLMAAMTTLLASVCGFGMSFFAGLSLWLVGMISGVLSLSIENTSHNPALHPFINGIAKLWSLDRFSLMHYSRDLILPDLSVLMSCMGYSLIGALTFLVFSHICFARGDVVV